MCSPMNAEYLSPGVKSSFIKPIFTSTRRTSSPSPVMLAALKSLCLSSSDIESADVDELEFEFDELEFAFTFGVLSFASDVFVFALVLEELSFVFLFDELSFRLMLIVRAARTAGRA